MRLFARRKAFEIPVTFGRRLDEALVYVREHGVQRVQRRVEKHGLSLDLERTVRDQISARRSRNGVTICLLQHLPMERAAR